MGEAVSDVWATPPTPEELSAAGGAPQSAPAPGGAAPPPSKLRSAAIGASQGATLGFGDELKATADALGIDPESLARAFAASPLGGAPAYTGVKTLQALAQKGPSGIANDYRASRDAQRAELAAAEKANPKSYMAGQIAGGVVPALVPGGAPATLGRAAVAGAGYGAAAGLGSSEADVTRGDVAGAAKDTAAGGAVGAAAGAAGHALSGLAGWSAEKLRGLGQARLFKAAVGQTKKAFTQLNGKGLLEKAGQYLDDMGIGFGDSTESIGQKLTARRDALGGALDEMVSSLDQASGGAVRVPAAEVADQIEKKVAAPLKRLAAAQGDYRQVMGEVENIRAIGQDMTFAEAAQQRAAMQAQVNYDVRNSRDIAAKAKREMAQIWNDVIDQKAEGLLKIAGKAGDAYRELRHEFSLAQDLLGHVNSRVAGNAANRVMSPSDYGAGGVAAIMTSNPVAGIAAATANHMARVYGNAAAGRTAINMARAASSSRSAAKALLPATLRAERPAAFVRPQLQVAGTEQDTTDELQRNASR